MVDTGSDSGIGHSFALTELTLLKVFVIDGKGGDEGCMGTLKDARERFHVIGIALNDLCTFELQRLGLEFVQIAGDGANLVLPGKLRILEEGINNGSTLATCGTEDD